jgi:hypothetical protein
LIPFLQQKPVGQGTGLGLSISYQIVVERHQGQLSCESTLGRGTTFKIEVPLQQLATALPLSTQPCLKWCERLSDPQLNRRLHCLWR